MSSDSDYGLANTDITWYTPDTYPSRVTPSISISIATLILDGVDFGSSCMVYGVAPTRARQWMKWGEAAYVRDANSSDRHAPYLDFFLKVMQALGIVAAKASRQVFIESPQWWISHYPQLRSQWATQTLPQEAVIGDAAPSDDTDVVTLPKLATPEVREVLRMLLEMGIHNIRPVPAKSESAPIETKDDDQSQSA